MIYIGLDAGTQGARAIAADERGNVAACASAAYGSINIGENGLKEQRPEDWTNACFECLASIAIQLKNAGRLSEVRALAVDGTSGTLLAVDKDFRPLTNGIMYNDARSKTQADEVQRAGANVAEKLGYRFNASYSLPKAVWIRQEKPDVYEKTRVFCHQTDYIVGALTGEFCVTDYSNALKSGYDIVDLCWPDYISGLIDREKLPCVKAPGEIIGRLTADAAKSTGLPEGTAVAAGATDGYVSAVACGAVNIGDFNSTIGSTLVIKGVSENIITDPQGRVYCHKHPMGWYYPGGAGNVGGLCVNAFGKENFDALNAACPALTPTGALFYPLTAQGERFPFVDADMRGFEYAPPKTNEGRYAATLEGVAFVERMCFELLEGLGCAAGDTIFIAGGAVKSPEWSQIRANVLGKRLAQPNTIEAAMGTAIIAATSDGVSIVDAAHSMVSYTARFEPQMEKTRRYNELHARFKALVSEKRNEHI